jgi:CheY-like chemotaxis protein
LYAREWRRYQLMMLRFVDGESPQAVADQLAISRRHYYRGQETGVAAIASILWNRYASEHQAEQSTNIDIEGASLNRLELLRLEAARMAQIERFANLSEVIDGVLKLLGEKIQQQQLTVNLSIPSTLPAISVDKRLLRQLLLAVLGYLIEEIHNVALSINTETLDSTVKLKLQVKSEQMISVSQERLTSLEELASLAQVHLQPLESTHGFEIILPANPPHLVLVVDDNEDILTLFQRYLSLHQYHVVTASKAQEALSLAVQLRPFAITLDLMMPDIDGWDLLQTLLTQPTTNSVPIIVCSVLRQKELALSLGAAAFLEKPVSEESLLSVLNLLSDG